MRDLSAGDFWRIEELKADMLKVTDETEKPFSLNPFSLYTFRWATVGLSSSDHRCRGRYRYGHRSFPVRTAPWMATDPEQPDWILTTSCR